MNRLLNSMRPWLAALLVGTLAACGGGGGRDEILGFGGTASVPPTVTAAVPANGAAGVATKAVMADQIRQKNELLGPLAWIGMNLADQADLRQWVSLPASFQIAKQRLKPGRHRLRIVGLSNSGQPTGEMSEWIEVNVKAGGKSFLNWRSFR